MVKKISPLAPKSFPKVPDIKGVKIGTAKSGVKYKGRNDIFTAIFDKGTSVAGVFTQSKIPAEPASVMLIGHEKGFNTETRLKHNFGMAHPEGYRKSIRLMKLAERFGLPVITFIDTPGAYPGVGAEERGQSEAIARSTDCSLGYRG